MMATSAPATPQTPATASAPMPNRRVVALVYDGLCVFEYGIATEIFGLPRPEFADLDWYEFEAVAVEPGPVRLLGGASMDVPLDLERVRRAGTIVIPGWRDVDVRPPEDLLVALRDAHAAGARLVSICSGAFVLAAAGLLDGRPATTHWRYAELLAARCPAADIRPDVLYVDAGQVLTSAGSAAGLDLGLHLVGRDHGAGIANTVARRLVMPPHRDGGQAQFIPQPIPDRTDDGLHTTMAWALERLETDLSIPVLAAHALMSPRTFARRFRAETGQTPHRWLVGQRIRRARELLEVSDLSVEAVAHASGFASAAALRPRFVEVVGRTPSSYRRAFGVS